jgi:hypothetical protein
MLLTDPLDGRVTVAAISSAVDLFDAVRHFRIDEEHNDFSGTGLIKTSYVLGDEIREIDVADLRQRAGQLRGELLRSFQKWIG